MNDSVVTDVVGNLSVLIFVCWKPFNSVALSVVMQAVNAQTPDYTSFGLKL